MSTIKKTAFFAMIALLTNLPASGVNAQSRYLAGQAYHGSNVSVNLGVLGDPHMLETHVPELLGLGSPETRQISNVQFNGTMPQMAPTPVMSQALSAPIQLTPPQARMIQSAPQQRMAALTPPPVTQPLKPQPLTPQKMTEQSTNGVVHQQVKPEMQDPRLPTLRPTPIQGTAKTQPESVKPMPVAKLATPSSDTLEGQSAQDDNDMIIAIADAEGNISSGSQKKLERIAQAIKKASGKATLRSYAKHTDPSIARRLSLVYAIQIRRQLMELGISPSDLSVRALGRNPGVNQDMVEVVIK